jgi:hypothetical protein
MGNIGEKPLIKREFEPFPEEAPVEEPSPEVIPAAVPAAEPVPA